MLLLSWTFTLRSGGSAVPIDQCGDGPSTVDPGGDVDHLARIVQQRSGERPSMQAMIV
jgi:hypothetical protein